MIRLAVRVRKDRAEIVLAELLALAPGGVEEVAVADDTTEYAIYGAPGELPALPALRALVADALVEISTSEVADDWSERWKRFHRAVRIAPPPPRPGSEQRLPALCVRPPWEPPAPTAHERVEDIVIDPGQAFGTGAHGTTRLCLALLLELAAAETTPLPLLDVGTGSGVLAIAAARLAFEPVLALDHERESVAAAQANARANGVAIEVRRFDLRTQRLPWLDTPQPRADTPQPTGRASAARAPGPLPAWRPVIVANLLHPLLLELAQTIASAPAHLLAGGLLSGQEDEVAGAFAGRLGLRERARRTSGEWSALWLTAR